jgi:hypothetical protein
VALPQGIAFRSTVGFVTDGANDYAEVLAIGSYPNYPTTSTQGNTVGWEQAPTSKFDYNAGADPRIAGIHGRTSAATADYRIDLPSTGSYNVRSAIGDTLNMADNVIANAGSGGATFAADDIGSVYYPRTKITLGADGSADGDAHDGVDSGNRSRSAARR